jgi:hypothetical protein
VFICFSFDIHRRRQSGGLGGFPQDPNNFEAQMLQICADGCAASFQQD